MKFPLNFIRKEYSNQSLSHCFTSVAIVIIAVNFCSVSTNRPWSQYNIEITQYLCDFDNRTFEDGNCTLKTIGGTQAMSVDAEIRPNVSVNSIFVRHEAFFYALKWTYFLRQFPRITSCANFQIKFSMQREQKKTLVPFMGLRNVTIDVCKLLRGVHDSIIVNVFLGHLQPKTNLWHPCPYTVR